MSLVELMVGLIAWWAIVRVADIVIRTVFCAPFETTLRPWYLPLLLLAEMCLVVTPALRLKKQEVRESHYQLFLSCFFIVLGGLGYRFDPTTFAYRRWSRPYYTPAVIEILISLGLVCFCIVCFLWAVKRLPNLPPGGAVVRIGNYYRKIYPYIQLSGYGDKNQLSTPLHGSKVTSASTPG